MSDDASVVFMTRLVDQFRDHGRRILGPDAAFQVRGASWSETGIEIDYVIEPGPVRVDTREFAPVYPDRRDLMNLLSRVYRVRSRRVDRRTWTIPPASDTAFGVLATHFPIYRGSSLEVGNGWFDLLAATADWLQESGGDFHPISQVKEKFGGLRMYGLMSGEAQTITDAASWLSICICDVCGAPGRKQGTGWITTRCDEHRDDR
jgi:hypothetical protein